MKLLVTISLISMSFLSSASNDVISDINNEVSIEMSIGGDRGKKARKNKRINKKRKRACAKFGRRGFAG